MTTVVLTRRAEDNAGLAAELEERGARVLQLPCVRAEAADPEPIAASVRSLASGDWLVVTSRAGVDAVRSAVGAVRPRARIAAVGPATALRLREWGIEPWVPSEPTGAALGRELPVGSGGQVLLARAEHSDPALPLELAARGVSVREVVAYRIVYGTAGDPAAARQALLGGATLMLASPGAADALVAAVGSDALAAARVLVIGPTTARRAADLGVPETRTIRITDAQSAVAEEVLSVAGR